MPDMLVKLYNLPENEILKEMANTGVTIRRAIAPEKHVVLEWVRTTFGNGWASECDVAFSNQPVSCLIAISDNKIVGFACHEATCKDYFGPTGVDPAWRGKGIGKALLIAALKAMKDSGYAYAIIGGAGPVEFYRKVVGATVIEDSVPGIYKGMLK